MQICGKQFKRENNQQFTDIKHQKKIMTEVQIYFKHSENHDISLNFISKTNAKLIVMYRKL